MGDDLWRQQCTDAGVDRDRHGSGTVSDPAYPAAFRWFQSDDRHDTYDPPVDLYGGGAGTGGNDVK